MSLWTRQPLDQRTKPAKHRWARQDCTSSGPEQQPTQSIAQAWRTVNLAGCTERFRMNEVVRGIPILDWDSLVKGSTLTPQECAIALGVTEQAIIENGLLLQKLVTAIRNRRPDLACHVRTHRHGIIILDDSGADEYSWHRVKHHVTGIGRQLHRRAAIDVSLLSASQRRNNEARNMALGRVAIEAHNTLASAEKKQIGDVDKDKDKDKK